MPKHILLIDVDSFDASGQPLTAFGCHHPVGLLYLVSAAKQQFPDITFKVFHTATSSNPVQQTQAIIDSFKPDLIGIRSLSNAKESFKLISEGIRTASSGTVLIGGGPYVTASYDSLLKNNLIDIAVLGEGELTFNALIAHYNTSDAIPEHINGTAIMKDGNIIKAEARSFIDKPDSIPFPDYNLIQLNDYKGLKSHTFHDTSETAFILCSRGCPYNCFYCHQNFGHKIRRRSAKNIIEEMRQHIEKRNIRDFTFLDDVFNMPMPEAKEILRLIAKELPGVRLYFPNGLRADHIDEEMADLFEQAGTVELALAIETATPRLQKIIGKHLNLPKAAEAIESLSKRFITRVFFITGFPTETFEEAQNTIQFAMQFEYMANPIFNVLRLYNNTKLYKYLNPTQEQLKAIGEQESKEIHMNMFGDLGFYGDLFSDETVPLKGKDLKILLNTWLRYVLVNPVRIQKSHTVVARHLTDDKILEFYRGVFNRPGFSNRDLEKLLKLD